MKQLRQISEAYALRLDTEKKGYEKMNSAKGRLYKVVDSEEDKIKKRVEELTKRNLERLNLDWSESDIKNYRNVVFLDGRNISAKYIGFHVGSANQKILIPGSFPGFPELNMGGVFFCNTLAELEHYFNPEKDEMVYFTDLRRARGKIQTSYKHKVLFQDEIFDRIDEFAKGEASREDVKKEVEEWIRKYTINYNPSRLNRYTQIGCYIILDSPLKVSLESKAQTY